MYVKLRQEQAGFQRERGCTYKIFSLFIIEQGFELNAPLSNGFIDAKKAFDIIHRSAQYLGTMDYHRRL